MGLMATEADTCRKFVVPKLQAAGWDFASHSITDDTAGKVRTPFVRPANLRSPLPDASQHTFSPVPAYCQRPAILRVFV